jgi:restriction endonuclease S subunit
MIPEILDILDELVASSEFLLKAVSMLNGVSPVRVLSDIANLHARIQALRDQMKATDEKLKEKKP